MTTKPKIASSAITKKHNQSEWFLMYERLKKFKRISGHCNVPKRYTNDQRLGHWVHYQRTMYKKSNLAQERVSLLESLGFVWMERPSSCVYRGTLSWETRYEGTCYLDIYFKVLLSFAILFSLTCWLHPFFYFRTERIQKSPWALQSAAQLSFQSGTWSLGQVAKIQQNSSRQRRVVRSR